jgi:hypothetical protein
MPSVILFLHLPVTPDPAVGLGQRCHADGGKSTASQDAQRVAPYGAALRQGTGEIVKLVPVHCSPFVVAGALRAR